MDYINALDRYQYGKVIESLERIGINAKDMRIISNVYWRQKAVVWIKEKTPIRHGVRQGRMCIVAAFIRLQQLLPVYLDK